MNKDNASSLRVKLFLSYLLLAILIISVFSATFFYFVQVYFKKTQENKYLNQANITATSIFNANIISNYDPNDKAQRVVIDNEIRSRADEGEYRLLVFNDEGLCIADSNEAIIGKYYSNSVVLKALGGDDNIIIYPDRRLVYAGATVFKEDKTIDGAVLIIDDLGEMYEFYDAIKNKTLMMLASILALILFLSTVISKSFVMPIQQMLDVLQELRSGHLHARMPVSNINEYKELSITFNAMAAELEAIDESRANFVSNVSHELKTPLSAIKVLSDSILYLDEYDEEIMVEFFHDINSEVDRLNDIVNDLLEIVRLDREADRLNITTVDTATLMNSIVKRLTPLADVKYITINTEFGILQPIEVDRVKISLAFTNIIENAIKYTDQGGIIDVDVKNDQQFLYVLVRDNGIGMEESELDKIFGRFYRVDKARDRQTGGTGLGLAITQSAILKHGGIIGVSSKVGEGTVFSVRIPLKNSEKGIENENN